jgi:hypothetical protein
MLRHVAIATAFGFLLVVLVLNNTSSSRQLLQHSFVVEQTSRKAREIQLASLTKLPVADSPAESARCVGLLHACQSWLALKDGVSNDIVITSPGQSFLHLHIIAKKTNSPDRVDLAGDGVTALVNHTGIVLPKAGHRISDRIWSVMQESCRYGFSDLR